MKNMKQNQSQSDIDFRMQDNQEVMKYLQEIGLDDVFIKQNEEISESNSNKSEFQELEHIQSVFHMDSVRDLQIMEVLDKQIMISMGDDCLIQIFNLTGLQSGNG